MSEILTLLIYSVVAIGMVFSGSRGPTFLKEQPLIVLYNETAGIELTCIADGEPVPNVIWQTDDGQPLNYSSELWYQRSFADGKSTLVIQASDTSDFASQIVKVLFECSATNVVGKIISKDVHPLPVDYRRHKPTTRETKVPLGNTAVLRCSARTFFGSFKFDGWIMTEGQNKSYLRMPRGREIGTSAYATLPTGELLLFNVTESVEKNRYACQVKNAVTEDVIVSEPSGRVIIKDIKDYTPPAIVMSHGDEVMEGEVAVLPCVAEGYPPLTYRWWYERIPGESEIVENKDDRVWLVQGALIFSPVLLSDEGTYDCRIYNQFGEQRSTVKLHVRREFAVEMYPKRQLVNIGATAEISCNVSRSTNQPIWWLKNGEPLQMQGERLKITNNVLRIADVQYDDKGMYQCFANVDNDGRKQAASELALADLAPTFMGVFRGLALSAGHEALMQCLAMGIPKPDITWYIYDTPVTGNQHAILAYDGMTEYSIVSSLIIPSVVVQDGGRYSCKAENRAGSVSHSARLNVTGPIQVRFMPNVTVMEGESVSLECPYSGYPVRYVRWTKDGSDLPVNGTIKVSAAGELFIPYVQKVADEGKYECTVSGTAKDDLVTRHTYITVLTKTDEISCLHLSKSGVLVNSENPSIALCAEDQLLQNGTSSTQQLRCVMMCIIIFVFIDLLI